MSTYVKQGKLCYNCYHWLHETDSRGICRNSGSEKYQQTHKENPAADTLTSRNMNCAAWQGHKACP